MEDDVRRLICEFEGTGTVLGFLEEFQAHVPDVPHTTKWRAYLPDGMLVFLEYIVFTDETTFLMVSLEKENEGMVPSRRALYSLWNYKQVAGWSFSKIEDMESLHTAPEFDDLMHLVPTRYDREVTDLAALIAGFRPFHPRPAQRRRNRVKAIMEADIQV